MNKFDNMFDLEELINDCEELAKNDTTDKGNYPELPDGKYEVRLIKCELCESKKSGKPMVAMWFEVIAGEYQGTYAFKYQLVDEPKRIVWLFKDLRKLGQCDDLKFTGFSDLEDLCIGIEHSEPELIIEQKTKGDFKNVYILEVF